MSIIITKTYRFCVRLQAKHVCQKLFYFESCSGNMTFVRGQVWQCNIDPVSNSRLSRAGFEWAARRWERVEERPWSSRSLSRAKDARPHHSTMLRTKFSSTRWIPPTKPELREVLNIIFLQLEPTNFSPSPSAPSECSASVTTWWSSYSTVNSRDSGRPPICCWST